MKEKMLTTIDNPFDPFTEFDKWFAFDTAKGYNSCNILGRVANVSNSMTEEEELIEINRAIEFICTVNPLGVHKWVEQ